MQKLLFHGKTAIITGAGNGLGRQYALELAKRGCNLVINDLWLPNSNIIEGESAANKVVQEIKALKLSGSIIANHSNVIDGSMIVKQAMEEFGAVDIIINNAGILLDKSFHKLPKEDWYKVINVHLNGTFELCHAAWPIMQARQYGRIINVSSDAGLFGNFGQSNYSAAKLGILGLSNTLAIEGAKHNIKVNCIVPVAASKMTEGILPKDILEILDPKHVAPMVAYLAHESCTETGSIYEIGGGWYSKVRIQRSKGITLGSTNEIATAEMIHDHIENIKDFTHSSNPSSIMDSLKELISEASVKYIPDSKQGNITSSESISNSNASNITLKSDYLFKKFLEIFANEPQT